MNDALQVLTNGLVNGSIFALVAVSLALIFGVLEIPHFAMGAIGVTGAYGMALMQPLIGTLGAIVVAVVIAVVVGCLTHATIFHPIRNSPPANQFLVAFAAMLLLQGLVQLIFGPQNYIVDPLLPGSISVADVTVTRHRLVVVLAALILIACLDTCLNRTRWGRQVRAVSQSSWGAAATGIDITRITFTTTAVASALAGLAAALIAPISQVYPTAGTDLVLTGFVIVVLAGMGSIRGALLGGFLVGLLISFGTNYISSSWAPAFPVLLLLGVLLVRPDGLFGRKARVA